MAQSNFEERIDTYEIESTNVMTGDRDRIRYLYYQLKMSMAKAKQIDIIVSFLMESGVRMLLNDMKRALDRGVRIRILTGNYLGITQPSALYLIKSELGDRVDLRLYNETSRSFHPKSYIFHYGSSNEIYIGSSNISKSALTSGIEWNYRFSDTLDKKNYELFYATFEDLFLNHSIIINDEELKRYSKAWKKPAVSRDLAKYDATEDGEDRNTENVRMLYRPRGAQIEALYALQESRMEGAAKGLVYAATGIGKTYLAAFDSAKYERVLFVAHREEILKQAAVSFKNVRNSEDYGFFDGKEKDRDKSVIFASVATLGRPEYLNEAYFPADYFDYVIIDEFHHAVTDQYRRIVEYFQPQFLLGLTATPERMDGKNIYEICDYNVPYQISLKEAINKGMLVPFHYYGVYDETDYSRLRIVKGHYDEQELNQAYIGNERRYDLIYKYYRKYRSLRAIGFCCSRQHAEDMAKEFCQRGVASAAVYIPGLPSKYAAHCYERNSRLLLQSRPDFSEQEHYNITLHHNGIESFQGSNIMCGFSKISLDEFHWHINITVNGMRLFNEGGQEIGRFEYYYGQRGNMGNRYISNQPLLQRWVVSKDAISKARCIVGCPNNIKINHAFDSVIRKYED